MQISALAQRLLRLVFSLSSTQTALSRPRLERRLAVARGGLNGPLDELSRLGLLDAQRLRLTFSGLAVAVALSARRKPHRRPASQMRVDSAALRAPIALFSERETPRAVA
jgi:hypothetical protein